MAWQVMEECGDIAMAIVQNKVDLIERATMSSEEAEALARRLNLRFYRTCVKEDLNVASGRQCTLTLSHAWKHLDCSRCTQECLKKLCMGCANNAALHSVYY